MKTSIKAASLGLLAFTALAFHPATTHAALYVGNHNSEVKSYDSSGAPNAGFSTVTVGDPGAVLVSGSTLYVADSGNGIVKTYDATTGAALNTSFISGLSEPFGLALSGNLLFVSDGRNLRVGEYNATTGAAINATFISPGKPFSLALSGDNLYVATSGIRGAGQVSEFSIATGDQVNAFGISGLPQSPNLAISGNHLFLGSGTTVQEYDATTGALINGNFVSGTPLAASGNDLFVLKNDLDGTTGNYSTIAEYDATTGDPINASLIIDPDGPQSLAISDELAAVPEPGTAFFGLALVGACAARRRRTAKV